MTAISNSASCGSTFTNVRKYYNEAVRHFLTALMATHTNPVVPLVTLHWWNQRGPMHKSHQKSDE